MGVFLKDDRANQALIQLNDALCESERNGGVEVTVIIIPHVAREGIHMSRGGKPLDAKRSTAAQMLEFAMWARRESRGKVILK